MQLDFQQVNYDGSLEDADRESLVDLVERFEDAQDANAAEFEAAKEQVEELEGAVSDFEDAKGELIAEISDAEQFDQVPLSEDELEDANFSKVREWHEFVHADLSEDDTEEGGEDDDGTEFDDMGEEGPIHGDGDEEDEATAFAKDLVDGLSGVNVE